jgi:hypothetical protein
LRRVFQIERAVKTQVSARRLLCIESEQRAEGWPRDWSISVTRWQRSRIAIAPTNRGFVDCVSRYENKGHVSV